MIRSLTIKGFLGIQAMQLDVGPGGALIEGGNGKGKTSVMKAIKAALDGAGVSPEAVRKGTDAAEILIDLDHDTVRRRISATGNTSLTVEDEAGSRRKAPQTYLSQLLGLALLDPLDLWLSGPKERRAMILRAVPCRAEPEAIARVLPTDCPPWSELLAGLGGQGWDAHGLEVVASVRAWAEGARKAAGRTLKDRQAAATAAALEASRAQAAAEALAGVPAVRAAKEALLVALQAQAEITARGSAAASMKAHVDARKGEAERLRGEAGKVRESAPLAPTDDEKEAVLSVLHEAKEAERLALDALTAHADVIRDLEERLRQARAKRDELAGILKEYGEGVAAAQEAMVRLERREKAAEAAFEKAAELDERATRELASVASIAGDAPSAEEVAEAKAAVDAATAEVRRAEEAERAMAAADTADAAAAAAAEAAGQAADAHAALDKAVKALANDIPRALLAGAAGALADLTIDGDTILVRDDHGNLVDVEQLNAAAQMRFAVNVARRLNAKSRIVLVDGLERIDDEQRAAFVALATADGYQLFATRVTSGPLQVSPIGGAS